MKLILPDGPTYTTAAPAPQLWRVLHDFELPRRLWHVPIADGNYWRVGDPEVFTLNEKQTPFGRDWQLLSYAINPGMAPKKWRAVYLVGKAFNNTTGFSDEHPRADYVNGLDLSAPLPKWDKTRVCGGAIITGRVDGADLVVDILDGRGPAPALDDLKPWHVFRAVNSIRGGVSNFPQNGGRPVLIPLVGSGEARIPLAGLEAI